MRMSRVDGYTSSALLYQWLANDLKHQKDNIRVFYHTNAKSHGLSSKIFSKILKSDVDLFIIADSSSNDKTELEKLSKKGKYVIVTDHHEVSDYEEINNVVIVNNQLGDLSNKCLSGVGVTSKFIEALGYSIDKYKDIIAIGQIADVMDMLDYQNRAYVNEGLGHIENLLVKAYFKKNRVYNPIINDVSYNIANYMNATIRTGTKSEKELMFRALANEEESFDYEKRNGEVVKETLQERCVRLSANCKSRQNNKIKKTVELCNKYITRNNLQNDKVIIIKNENNFIDKTTVGLVATKLMDSWKKCCIILNENDEEHYSGSMRSIREIENFKDILEETELFEWVRGHQGAAGIFIKKSNIDTLRLKLNERLKDFTLSDGRIYNVDSVIDITKINKNDIEEMKEIGKLKPLWCGTCKEPLFAIKNITIDNVKIKKEGLHMEFKSSGVKFIKDWCSNEFYESLSMKNTKYFGKSLSIDITLVVKFKVDKYDNLIAEIVDAQSVKSSKIIF